MYGHCPAISRLAYVEPDEDLTNRKLSRTVVDAPNLADGGGTEEGHVEREKVSGHAVGRGHRALSP
jgi:hypothetical protein